MLAKASRVYHALRSRIAIWIAYHTSPVAASDENQSQGRAVRAVGVHGNTPLPDEASKPNGGRGALTKSFRNSKLHIRATMLLKIKGDFLKATILLKTIGLN